MSLYISNQAIFRQININLFFFLNHFQFNYFKVCRTKRMNFALRKMKWLALTRIYKRSSRMQQIKQSNLVLRKQFYFTNIKKQSQPYTQQQAHKIQITKQQFLRVRNIIADPSLQPNQNDPNFFDSQQQNLSFKLMQQQNTQGVINIAKRYISADADVNLQFLVFYRFFALKKTQNHKQSQLRMDKLQQEIQFLLRSIMNRIKQLKIELFSSFLNIICQRESLVKQYIETVREIPNLNYQQVQGVSEAQPQAQIILSLLKLHGASAYQKINRHYVLDNKNRYRIQSLVEIFHITHDPSIMRLIQFGLCQIIKDVKQQGKQMSEEVYELIMQYQRSLILAMHSDSQHMSILAQRLLSQQQLLRVLPFRKKIQVVYNILTKQVSHRGQAMSGLLDLSIKLILSNQAIDDLITSNQVQSQGITEQKMPITLFSLYSMICKVFAIAQKQKIKTQLQDPLKLTLIVSWLMKQSRYISFENSNKQDLFQFFVNFSFLRISIGNIKQQQFQELQYFHVRKIIEPLKVQYFGDGQNLDELAMIVIICKKIGLQQLITEDPLILKKLNGYSGKFSGALSK